MSRESNFDRTSPNPDEIERKKKHNENQLDEKEPALGQMSHNSVVLRLCVEDVADDDDDEEDDDDDDVEEVEEFRAAVHDGSSEDAEVSRRAQAGGSSPVTAKQKKNQQNISLSGLEAGDGRCLAGDAEQRGRKKRVGGSTWNWGGGVRDGDSGGGGWPACDWNWAGGGRSCQSAQRTQGSASDSQVLRPDLCKWS